jgi:2-methylcitrate dehydratase PrpD
MPFCAAAAVVHGRVGVDTFDEPALRDAAVRALLPRVSLRVDPAFDASAPLPQARVTVRLRDGRVLSRAAEGARGYPGRVSEEELAVKFAACARRTLPPAAAEAAWAALRRLDDVGDVRELTETLTP